MKGCESVKRSIGGRSKLGRSIREVRVRSNVKVLREVEEEEGQRGSEGGSKGRDSMRSSGKCGLGK